MHTDPDDYASLVSQDSGEMIVVPGTREVEELQREGKKGKVYGADHFKQREQSQRHGAGVVRAKKLDAGTLRRASIFEDVVIAVDGEGKVVGVGSDPVGRDDRARDGMDI